MVALVKLEIPAKTVETKAETETDHTRVSLTHSAQQVIVNCFSGRYQSKLIPFFCLPLNNKFYSMNLSAPLEQSLLSESQLTESEIYLDSNSIIF